MGVVLCCQPGAASGVVKGGVHTAGRSMIGTVPDPPPTAEPPPPPKPDARPPVFDPPAPPTHVPPMPTTTHPPRPPAAVMEADCPPMPALLPAPPAGLPPWPPEAELPPPPAPPWTKRSPAVPPAPGLSPPSTEPSAPAPPAFSLPVCMAPLQPAIQTPATMRAAEAEDGKQGQRGFIFLLMSLRWLTFPVFRSVRIRSLRPAPIEGPTLAARPWRCFLQRPSQPGRSADEATRRCAHRSRS